MVDGFRQNNAFRADVAWGRRSGDSRYPPRPAGYLSPVTRRGFIQAVGVGAAVSCSTGCRRLGRQPDRHHLGIVANTVAEALRADPAAATASLVRAGYDWLELRYEADVVSGDIDLARLGLPARVWGVGLDTLLSDPELAFLRAAPLPPPEYVVTYWPWRSAADALSVGEIVETAGYLTQIGSRLAGAGIGFAWHNHDKEFALVEGRTAFDRLVDATDPAFVNVQLDTYWALRGGADPLALMRAHPGRIRLLHLKDIDAAGNQACLGAGRLDLVGLLALRESAGVVQTAVELDRPADELGCAATAAEAFRSGLVG